MSKDLGWSNVGFHNDRVHTPAIDALRRDGIEFTRHYAYKFCSPSRSSFLSGRLPVHVNEHNKITEAPLAGVHPNMTMLPAKLKEAGYATHHLGKWHAGFASRSTNIPTSRGFDTSLAYFHGAEDHYLQICGGNIKCAGHPTFADFWLNDAPATGLNGTDYSLHIYAKRALQIIDEHDASIPLFLYFAFDNNHAPLEVPKKYMNSYRPASLYAREWRLYQGMITAVDVAVANVTAALKAKGMWDNALVIWTSDNGGPVYGKGGANNYPLRGGKISDWEGGFRVATAVSGGLVPAARRNATWTGVSHFADWYATFCALAGVDPTDTRAAAAGLPPVDGVDLRAAIMQGAASPRAGKPLFLASHASDPMINPLNSSVLVLDDYKLLTGSSLCSAWAGPLSPNVSHPRGTCAAGGPIHSCGDAGCMFNVAADPGEHVDLASTEPTKLQELQGLLAEARKSVFNPDRGDPGTKPCDAAIAAGGYWAPYLP